MGSRGWALADGLSRTSVKMKNYRICRSIASMLQTSSAVNVTKAHADVRAQDARRCQETSRQRLGSGRLQQKLKNYRICRSITSILGNVTPMLGNVTPMLGSVTTMLGCVTPMLGCATPMLGLPQTSAKITTKLYRHRNNVTTSMLQTSSAVNVTKAHADVRAQDARRCQETSRLRLGSCRLSKN